MRPRRCKVNRDFATQRISARSDRGARSPGAVRTPGRARDREEPAGGLNREAGRRCIETAMVFREHVASPISREVRCPVCVRPVVATSALAVCDGCHRRFGAEDAMTASAYRLAPALDAGFTLRDRWASLRPRLVVAVLAVMT